MTRWRSPRGGGRGRRGFGAHAHHWGHRRPGRPRSAAADAAIVEATVALLAERGFDGLSVDAVAERAGVSKATIYRRYPTKVDLALEVIGECAAGVAKEPTGDAVRDDLLAILEGLARFLDTPAGRAIQAIQHEAVRNPELAAAKAGFVRERRRGAIEAVRRGIARGELRADTDPELLVDLLAGPVFYRATTGQRTDATRVEALVDTVLRAFTTS